MDGTVTVARRNGDGTATERSRKRFRNERFTVTTLNVKFFQKYRLSDH